MARDGGRSNAAEFETAEAPGSSDLGVEIRAGVRALEGGNCDNVLWSVMVYERLYVNMI